MVKWSRWLIFSVLLTFKFIPRLPMGNCFWHYYRQIFISLVLRKCKKDSDELKIILVQRFSPLKVKIARFLVGFRRNYLMCSTVLRLINEGGKRWFFLTGRWSVYVTPGCFKNCLQFWSETFYRKMELRWEWGVNISLFCTCHPALMKWVPLYTSCIYALSLETLVSRAFYE